MTPVREFAASAFWAELERILEGIQRHVSTVLDLPETLPLAQQRNGSNGSFPSLLEERALDASARANPVTQLQSIFDLSRFDGA